MPTTIFWINNFISDAKNIPVNQYQYKNMPYLMTLQQYRNFFPFESVLLKFLASFDVNDDNFILYRILPWKMNKMSTRSFMCMNDVLVLMINKVNVWTFGQVLTSISNSVFVNNWKNFFFVHFWFFDLVGSLNSGNNREQKYWKPCNIRKPIT